MGREVVSTDVVVGSGVGVGGIVVIAVVVVCVVGTAIVYCIVAGPLKTITVSLAVDS